MAEADEKAAIESFRSKKVVVMADESLDLKNRKVLNILMAPCEPGGRFRLVATKFMDQGCTGAIVSQAIIKTLVKLNIPEHSVVGFKTDNAKYTLTAGQNLKTFYPKMIHSTCWSYVLHLVSEEIRDSLSTADSYIAAVKFALAKAPARRAELLDTFAEHQHPKKLPIVPVLTCWGTWLEAGSFHFQHLEAELDWIKTTEPNSIAVKDLKALSSKPALKQQLKKIDEICATVTSTIKTLERNNLPASDVWLLLKTLKGAFSEVFDKPPSKLTSFTTTKHPALKFWEQVQYFDHRKADIFCADGTEVVPECLLGFSSEPIPQAELFKYRQIRAIQVCGPGFCPFRFWKSFAREMPRLSALALQALSFPSSSAEVERSFSALRRILTPQRSSFTQENLDSHLKLAFNKRYFGTSDVNGENNEPGVYDCSED